MPPGAAPARLLPDSRRDRWTAPGDQALGPGEPAVPGPQAARAQAGFGTGMRHLRSVLWWGLHGAHRPRGPSPSPELPAGSRSGAWRKEAGTSQGRHLQGHQLLLNPRPRADRAMGPAPPRRGTCPRGETGPHPPAPPGAAGGTGALGHSGGHSRRNGQAAPPTDPARGACISSHVPGAGLGSALVPNSAQKARLRTHGRVRLGKGLG